MLTNENAETITYLRVSHKLMKLILYVINYLKKKIKLIINSIEIITINIIPRYIYLFL